MKKIISFFSLFFLLCFTACKDATLVFDPESNNDYKQKQFSTLEGQFDYIWTGLNNSYLFWDADTTDWDAVREKYIPKFHDLDELGKSGQEVTDDTIRHLIEEVHSSLLDRHSILYMSNPYNPNPRLIQVSATSKFSLGQLFFILAGGTYAKNALLMYHNISKMKSFDDDDMTSYSCVIDNSIPFLHVSNYFMTSKDYCEKYPSYKIVVEDFFNNIRSLSEKQNLKGIIIDNRFCLGGNLDDLYLLAQTFSSSSITPFCERSKIGLGKYDYSPWIAFTIDPDLEKYIDIKDCPIVILQNQYSMSGGELTGHVLSFLSNSRIIGEQSFGALSPVSHGAFPILHSGSFNVSNLDKWDIKKDGLVAGVQTVSACCEMRNKKTGKYEQLEGIGITPDEYVELDLSDFKSGIGDNQLEAALNYIKKKK